MSNQNAILSYLPIGIRSSHWLVSFVTDKDERIIYTNTLFLKTYLGSASSAQPTDLSFFGDDAESLSQNQKKAEKQPDTIFETATNTSLNNNTISVYWEISALKNENNAIIGFLYVGENINQKKTTLPQ